MCGANPNTPNPGSEPALNCKGEDEPAAGGGITAVYEPAVIDEFFLSEADDEIRNADLVSLLPAVCCVCRLSPLLA